MNDTSRWQAPLPERFIVPPLIQPTWRFGDLFGALAPAATQAALRTELCRQYGVRHCVLLDRARSGLYLLAECLGLKNEWLMTAFMHRPTAVLLRNLASDLAFADVDDDLNMDVGSAARMINRRTQALLVTHMYGKAADIVGLRRLADEHGIFLVENAVHMAGGVRIGNRPLGSWGDATVLSFNVDKPLGGLLGGALLTNRSDVWEAVNRVRVAGARIHETLDRMRTTYLAYRAKPWIVRLGLAGSHSAARDGVAEIESFGLDRYRHYTPHEIHPLQAAVALRSLHRSETMLATRKAHALRLLALIHEHPILRLPHHSDDRPHTFLYFPIQVAGLDRLNIARRYAAQGIETKWRYHPLHLQPDFADCRRDDLASSERGWREHLLLPVGPWLDDDDVIRIADCTNRIMCET